MSSLKIISQFLSAFGYRICPYLLIMIGISYSGTLPQSWKRRLSHWLLLPFFLTFAFDLAFPRSGFLAMYIPKSPFFWATEMWAIPYGIMGNVLLGHAFLAERDLKLKKQRFLVFLVTSPTLVNIIISYKPRLLRINQMWVFNMWPVFILVAAAIAILIRYGLLGMKITLERTSVEKTVKAVSTGTSVLNHAIKNELQVINAGVATLRSFDQDERNTRVINIIANASRHLMEMTSRIQQKIQETDIVPGYFSLKQIVEESLENINLVAVQKNIVIAKHFFYTSDVYCDRIQVLEVLNNLYNNAIEAMPEGGLLTISVYPSKKQTIIRVTDTGVGIPRHHLSRVIEPFFTTKKFGANYGLGLTYCYNVMQKHGGSIDITSVENEGTVVTLAFPEKNIKRSVRGSLEISHDS